MSQSSAERQRAYRAKYRVIEQDTLGDERVRLGLELAAFQEVQSAISTKQAELDKLEVFRKSSAAPIRGLVERIYKLLVAHPQFIPLAERFLEYRKKELSAKPVDY